MSGLRNVYFARFGGILLPMVDGEMVYEDKEKNIHVLGIPETEIEKLMSIGLDADYDILASFPIDNDWSGEGIASVLE